MITVPLTVEEHEQSMDALFASFDSTHSEVRRQHDERQGRYAHLVEEDVHPYQALCGAEQMWDRVGPPPPICPKFLAIYEAIEGDKTIEWPGDSDA